MAKFNTYGFKAENDDGKKIAEGSLLALSRQSAWMKAVGHAFDSIEPGTGDAPAIIEVWRVRSPSESQG